MRKTKVTASARRTIRTFSFRRRSCSPSAICWDATSPREHSAVEQPHPGLGVARARGDAFRRHGIDPRELALAQRDADRLSILLEPGALFRARDRHDVVAARQQPAQGQLRRRTALLARDLLDLADEVQVLLEVRSLKPGRAAAEVAGGQVVELLEPAREKPASQRAVGHEPDAQRPAGRQDVVLRIPTPERVLRLQGGDRMHGVGPAPRRLSEASQQARTYSGRPLTPRAWGSEPRTIPNLVASTTWSRRPAIAWPTSCSLV